jgi:hypothetical protein
VPLLKKSTVPLIAVFETVAVSVALWPAVRVELEVIEVPLIAAVRVREELPGVIVIAIETEVEVTVVVLCFCWT